MRKYKKEEIAELEELLLKEYSAEAVNTTPKTEKELLSAYKMHGDILYQYVRATVNHFVHAISNEIRALLGHLSEYRVSGTSPGKRDLDKAYGHFRRMNLDALKIICDEFDRTLAKTLKRQCKYDYRNAVKDYLLDFGEKYIRARDLYLEAQKEERVGCDSHTHNIIELYYNAAKEYILLKQFYQSNKKKTKKVQRVCIIKKVIVTAFTFLGIAVTAIGLTM